MKNYFEELQKVLLTKEEVEIRPAHEFNEHGFTLVPYKNRNTDKNILDRIVGPANWQKGHNGRAEMCYVEIWDEDKAQWVRKENFGGMQNGNGNAKALATDALKRVGEDWGIGRELYTAPKIFIASPMTYTVDSYNAPKWSMPADVAEKYSSDNIVIKELTSEIIDGAKTMTKIVLAFADDGVVFYEWERGKEAEAGKVKKTRKKSAAAQASAPSEPVAPANAEEAEETEANVPEEAQAQSPAQAEAPAEQTEDPLASYTGDPLDAPLTLLADYPSDGSLAPYIGKPIRAIPEGHLSIVLRGQVPWSNIMSEAMYKLIEKAFLGE